MPKRNKPKKSRRQPQRRTRTRAPLQLLDLSDEVLLKILQNLGWEQVLTPLTLRKTTPAFLLALTCKRLYRIFLENITDINLQKKIAYPPPLYHRTHSDAHVRWLISNLPNLRLLELPQERAHLLNSLPATLRLETLKYEGDCNLVSPTRFPRSLRVLHMSRPTDATMDYLANLHESTRSCRLQEIFFSAVRPAHVEQLRTFFIHSCSELDYFYTSFALSRDYDQRDDDNELVTSCMSFISSNHEEYAPKLSKLCFAVTGESRMDLDFHGYDMESLTSLIDPVRAGNTGRKHLHLISLWTDCALLESWFNAIRSCVTPFVGISIESGHSCMFYLPPLKGCISPMIKYRLTSRIISQTDDGNPSQPSLRCEVTGGVLRYLCVTERFVVEKFFFNSEFRNATLACLGETEGITNIALYFAFGLPPKRAFFWVDGGDSANASDLSILTGDHDETPEEMAYTFLVHLLSISKGVETLSLSFEAVSYAPDHELLVHKILQGLPDATEIEMLMPNENCEGHPRDGLVDVTKEFLVGLPVFLQLLTDCCPKLETVTMVHVGDMTWEHEDNRQALMCSAEQALDLFEQRRPTVYVENVRAMLEFWKPERNIIV